MTANINGFCDRRFEAFRRAFQENFDNGLEIGASLAVTWRGKPVVDLWAGWSDLQKTKPWRKNTIVDVFSVCKVMLIMCVMKLVDRGKLALDEPVCHYWPEFGENGKDKITVRDFLTHRGGIPVFDPPVTFEDLKDWKRITEQLAAQPYRFDEKSLCYHPVTFGFVIGELIRRVDGRYPNQFLRDEFTKKLHADFLLGLSSRRDMRRVAEVEIPPQLTPEEAAIRYPDAEITEVGFLLHDQNYKLIAKDLMSWEALSLLNPAANGYGTSRAIARLCAILVNGGRLGWRRFISQRMADEASIEQAAGQDPYLGFVRWGLGFAMDSDHFPAPTPTSIHWGGFGGAWAVMDPQARISFAYAPNNLVVTPIADPRHAQLGSALRTTIAGLAG